MTAAFEALRVQAFRGTAKRIEDEDLPRIGHALGVGEDEIHAIIDVESSGSGFDAAGRPKILFEPHVFYRNLSGAKRDLAVAQGLAYKKWVRGKYPPDSYPRFHQALAIDVEAAIKACSWGLGQILGENFADAGYDSPQDMVVAYCEDEDDHLESMANFIIANRLDDELRRHDWNGFARGYNGAQYAVHNYHGRLAAAYIWWKAKRDTPWTPGQPEPIPEPLEPIVVPPVVVEPPTPEPPPVTPPQPPAPVFWDRSGPVWETWVWQGSRFGLEITEGDG